MTIPIMSNQACLLARKALIDHVQKQTTSPLSEQVGSAIKTGYLANITSAIKHVTSLAGRFGVEGLLTHPANVMVDYLSHLATGSDRTTANMWSTRSARIAGRAFANGTKEFLSAMRKGYDPERVGNAFDTQPVRLSNPMLASAQQFVQTFVSARNKPFFDMALQVNLLRRARVMALNEGFKGAELEARTDHYLAHPTDGMSLGALADANAATFSDPSFVDRGVGWAKKGLQSAVDGSKALSIGARAEIQAVKEGLVGDKKAARVAQLTANPGQITVPASKTQIAGLDLTPVTRMGGKAALLGLDVLAPFPRIGANIASAGIDYSPVGLFKALAQGALAEKGEGAAIIRNGITKATVGTAAGFTAGYYLASKGKIQGPDAAHPYTYRDDNSVDHSMAAFAPVSLMPLMGAAFFFEQQKHPDQQVWNVVKAQGEYLKELSKHSILQAMGNVAGMASGAATSARSIAGMFLPVPPIAGQVARGTDTKRDTRDPNIVKAAGKQAIANIPGLDRTLPPRLDAFGREQPAAEGFVGSVLDPTSPVKGPTTAVDSLLEHLGIKPREPGTSVTIGGQKVERTPAEQLEYERRVGPVVVQAIETVSKDPDFKKLPREQQAKVIRNVIEKARVDSADRAMLIIRREAKP